MSEIDDILLESDTQLNHMCSLRFDKPAQHRRLANIMCTISDASRSLQMLQDMIKAGMNIVRLNFSHDSHEQHLETIRFIREAEQICAEDLGYDVHIAIAADTKGPEIRTGFIEGSGSKEVELKKNEYIRLSTNKDLIDRGNRDCVFVDYENIVNAVQPGNKIFINDGAIALKVREVAVDCVICQIEVGGMLGSRKNVTLPKIPEDLPSFSEKDRYDIKFCVDHNVDILIASLIRTPVAIKDIRTLIGDKGKDMKILAKIENLLGLEHLDEIIQAADGILVARADLGVEIPPEKLLLVQKGMIAHCNRAGKPVICATRFLQSMRYNPIPTYSEVADLGNAVLDGADNIMLSSETAVGQYPLECVIAAANICREAESALWYRQLFEDIVARNPAMIDAAHAVAIAAVDATKKSLATAIIVLTTSGRSAYLLSRYRPRCPILAVTRCVRTARQSLLYRGIVPLLYTAKHDSNWLKEIDNRVHFALNNAKKMGITKMGDAVIILSPWKDGGGFTNNMRIVYVFYEKDNYECDEFTGANEETK